ncbi:MAG: hypothetical protein AAF378_17830 [Cyanobacteria bacterium P01_A01_bin.84]
MSTENQKPETSNVEEQKPDSSRSPGVTDRDPNASKSASKSNENKETNSENKTDSPGVDRG